jgi:polysaccharide biosynthesis protein PslG
VRIVPALLLSLLLALAAAPGASAARAPDGFYGVTYDTAVDRAPWPVVEQHWDTMARSGVETVRVVFNWADMQPSRDGALRLGGTDPIVARAARRRIRVLPIVFDAPRWAKLSPRKRHSPPAYPGDYARFMRALVERYGRGGSFWREHPETPTVPIVEYQAWNEPHLRFYWNASRGSHMGWPRGYVTLLSAARRAIKGRDRRAKVVLAGLSERSWTLLASLYRRRARRLFDVVALHPYNASLKDALTAARLTRSVMRRYGDRRKPLWITELGWPAARGKLRVNAGLRRLTTTDGGMARRVKTSYAEFVSRRRSPSYGVSRLYWFTWASSYSRGEGGIWNYAGLVWSGPAGFVPTPALRAYRSSARRYGR